jgi:hypothetical protein
MFCQDRAITRNDRRYYDGVQINALTCQLARTLPTDALALQGQSSDPLQGSQPQPLSVPTVPVREGRSLPAAGGITQEDQTLSSDATDDATDSTSVTDVTDASTDCKTTTASMLWQRQNCKDLVQMERELSLPEDYLLERTSV